MVYLPKNSKSRFKYKIFDRKKFVETQTFRELVDLTEQKRSPIILTGPAGSGKSINLWALIDRAIRNHKLALFIQIREIRGETDLINSVRDQLQNLNVGITTSISISSSADIASGSFAELVNALPEVPLVVFDDVSEAYDNTAVRVAIDDLLRMTRAIIVISGRDGNLDGFNFNSNRSYLVQIPRMSLVEIEQFIKQYSKDATLKATATEIARVSSGSPLLIAMLLESLEQSDLNFIDFEQKLVDNGNGLLATIIDKDLVRFTSATQDERGVQEYISLLTATSVRLRVPLNELKLSTKKLRDYIESSFLLVISGNYVELVHLAFAARIQKYYGLLPQKETMVSDLSFGMEEAERDNLLKEHFQIPNGMDELQIGKKTIVVGDRGSGKSAIFSQLIVAGEPSSEGILTVAIRDPSTWIEKMETDSRKLDTSEEYRAAWRLSAAITISQSQKISREHYQSKTAKSLRLIFAPRPSSEKKTLGERVRSLMGGTRLKFGLGPISIEANPETSMAKTSKEIAVDSFLDDIDKSLEKRRQKIILAIDRIDEIHKYDRSRQERLVQGLFQAEGDMAAFNSLSFLIFIRSDLFHVYAIEEKNKLVSRTLELRWDEEKLLNLMLVRVFSDARMSQLKDTISSRYGGIDFGLKAAFPEIIEGVPFTDWLWTSIRNGNGQISPRQLVLLLILAREAPDSRSKEIKSLPIFSEPVLRFAMSRLSEISFEEMVDDFRVAPTFLRNCRAAKISEFRANELRDLFDEKEGEINLQIDHLERLGFLERVVKEDTDGNHSSYFKIPLIYGRSWMD